MSDFEKALTLAGIRAEAYRLLASLLDYPYDEDMDTLDKRLGELEQLLEEAGSIRGEYRGLSENVEVIRELLESEVSRLGRDMFQAEYVAMFELGMPKPLCPPYESEYVEPGEIRGESFIDVPGATSSPQYLSIKGALDVLSSLIAFYEKHGVEVKNATPDHLVVELEFMQYLVDRELGEISRHGNPGELRKAQLYFMETHLDLWIGRLVKCLGEKATLKTYLKLFELLRMFLKADEEFLKASTMNT